MSEWDFGLDSEFEAEFYYEDNPSDEMCRQMAPGRPKKRITCEQCGCKNLHWVNVRGKWKLAKPNESVPHKCEVEIDWAAIEAVTQTIISRGSK